MKMRKGSINIFRILFLIFLFLLLVILLPMSYSRYESKATSNVNTGVAHYILNPGYQYINVKIPNLVPKDEPYIYNFSISNFKDGVRTETLMEYDLMVKTTTNLQLDYKLYMNENYQNSNSTNIIVENNIIQDSYGTYFKEMKTNKNYFTYLYNETNNYTLLIYFPKTFVNYKYQDILESIFIVIESKQVIQ